MKGPINKESKVTLWLGWPEIISIVFGFIVFIGLAMESGPEIVALIMHGTKLPRSLLGEGLVTVGVFGEVAMGIFIARSAKRQEIESAMHIAELNLLAEQARQKAEEATLELARFKAPRVLTQEQRGRIVEKLKHLSNTEYDIAISDADPEILNFVFILELVLSTAGWTELNWLGSGEALIRPGQPLIRLGASVANVEIGVHVNQPPKLFERALTLSNALISEDVNATAGRHIPHEMSSTNANAIHLLIGRKT